MAINLQVDEKDAQTFVVLLRAVRKQIEEESAAKLLRIDEQIEALSNGGGHWVDITSEPIPLNSSEQSTHPDGYDPNWKWLNKIRFAITALGGKATTTEIIEKVQQYEPKYKSDRSTAMRSISGILSSHVKKREVFAREEVVPGNYVYMLRNDEPKSHPHVTGLNNAEPISTEKEHE